MKKIFATIVFAALIVSCNKSNTGSGGDAHVTDKLTTNDQKAGYAYGMSIGQQVLKYEGTMKYGLNKEELEKGILDYLALDKKKRQSYATGQNIGLSMTNFLDVQNLEGIVDEKYIVQGLMDVLREKKTLFPADSINIFMQEYVTQNVEKMKNENTKEGQKFLAEKKKDPNVKSTESGLLYEVVKEGSGESPIETDRVEVNYVGKTIDGEIFDQSKEGEPVPFPVNGVIKGWQEGLMLMKPGAKFKLYIPAELAYGEYGSPDGKIEPNETLIFDVELVSVQKTTPPEPTVPSEGK